MSDTKVIVVCWLIALACTLFGAAIGSTRDRPLAGAFLGFLLGPLGLPLALFLPLPPRGYCRRRR